MTIVKREIDVGNEVIEVEFKVKVTKNNDSYSDFYGIVKGEDYYFAENIDWSTASYSLKENNLIERYLSRNYDSIQNEAVEKYLDEFEE